MTGRKNTRKFKIACTKENEDDSKNFLDTATRLLQAKGREELSHRTAAIEEGGRSTKSARSSRSFCAGELSMAVKKRGGEAPLFF